MSPVMPARGPVLPRLFLVLFGACLLALPAAVNRGPIYFFDTVGYVRNGSVALEKVFGIPSAAPVSDERDPANPAPAVGEDANVKWGNRSLYYGAVMAAADLLHAMSVVVVAQALALAWLLFLCWRILGPPVTGGWGFAGFCAALALLTPLGLFVAYLIPDILHALVIPAIALLLLYRDRMSRAEAVSVVVLIVAACLSHASAAMLTAAMLVLSLPAIAFVARRRIPWDAAGGVAAALAIALASNWAVARATERAFGSDGQSFPVFSAR